MKILGGYSNFINEHKKSALPCFLLCFFIILFIPTFYHNVWYYYAEMFSFSFLALAFGAFFFNESLVVQYNYYLTQGRVELTWEQFYDIHIELHTKSFIPNFIALGLFIAILIIVVFMLIWLYKKNKIFKPLLLFPPLIAMCFDIWYSTYIKLPLFVGFYLLIPFVILELLYIFNFQKFRFRSKKTTKSERIAELERQIAELKSTQNSTDEEILP